MKTFNPLPPKYMISEAVNNNFTAFWKSGYVINCDYNDKIGLVEKILFLALILETFQNSCLKMKKSFGTCQLITLPFDAWQHCETNQK
jgi:hypothetical protein